MSAVSAAGKTDAAADAGAAGCGAKIDGKAMAGEVQAEVKAWAEEMRLEHSVTPGLGLILVGDRSDSKMYVRLKQRAATRCGLHSTLVKLSADVSQVELEREVDTLMANADVHGVLVQLPLPEHIDIFVAESGAVIPQTSTPPLVCRARGKGGTVRQGKHPNGSFVK